MKRFLLVVFSVFLLVAFAFGAPSDRQRKAIAEKLYGRIKIVDFAEDYRVKIVDFAEDLEVKIVDFAADSVGRWEIVDFAEDYRVKIVDFAEDLRVEIENPEAFPCLN